MPLRRCVLPFLALWLSASPCPAGNDARALFKDARAAYDRGAYAEAAALGEAILRQGREHPKVLCLIARCRAKTGARDVARSLVQRALELKPGDAEAAALAAELDGAPAAGPKRTPTTLPERLFGPLSAPAKEALAALHGDDFEEAMERANTALANDPADPGGLFVRAIVQSERLEDDAALRDAEFLRGRFPAAGFLEVVLPRQPDPARVKAFLAAVESDPKADPIALALLATHKRTLLQCGAARRLLARAVQAVQRPDRETLVTIAQAATELSDHDTASRALDEHKALFGENADSLSAAAELRFRQGRPEEAARLITDAYHREPQRMKLLQKLMSIYINAGKEADLFEQMKLLHEAFPDRKDVEGKMVAAAVLYLRKQGMGAYNEDIFHIRVQPGLSENVVARVLATFKDAHRKVGAKMGHFPHSVRLVIFDQIIEMPSALAYFSPFDDTIYVGAVHYAGDDQGVVLQARTVSEHEFTHYVHAEMARKKGLPLRVNDEVGWLCEGLAEWASDGLTWRLSRNAAGIRAMLLGGTIPLADVENPTLLADVGFKIKSWYVQGHLMVKYLLEREPDRARQIDRLVAMSVDLDGAMDLDDALRKHFGIDSVAFEKGYTELIRREAAEREKKK